MLRRGCGHGLTSALKLRSSRQTLIPRCVHYNGTRAFADQANNHNVAILGGGITGLATAYFLTQQLPRAKVTIYEASDRIGGWLSSKRVPVKDGTVLFEAGPRTLRPAQNGVLAAKLIQELDLGNETIFTQNTAPAAQNRYLYYPDHLVRMPHPSFGFWENLQNIWSEPIFDTALLAGIKEFWKDPRDEKIQDESVGDFFARRFSPQMVDRILSGMMHGIYAGDVYKLSAKSLFPRPFRDEVRAGGIIAGAVKARAEGLEMTKHEADFLQDMKAFNWDPLLRATLRDTSVFTFKDGISMLVDRLARKLWATGNVEVKTSTPVKSLRSSDGKNGVEITSFTNPDPKRYDHVVSTLSPAHLNALAPDTTTLAPATPAATVMTVNLYYSQPDMHPPGFGYLIPLATPFEHNPERALGVVFDTAYSPSNADTDPSAWHINDLNALKQQRDQGRMVNVNDFAWYNMPDKPVIQDEVPQRGTKVTVMLGGHWWDDWPAYPSEEEGLAMAKSIMARHLGIHQEPEAHMVNLQKDCIPQYTVGHETRLKQAHNTLWREYRGKLRVAGSWVHGVGVNDCLRSAWDVVKGLREGRDGTGLEKVGNEEFVRLKPVRTGSAAAAKQHE